MEATQATAAAIAAAAPGMGRVIYGDFVAELMKITVENGQVVLWLSRADLPKFGDMEPGDNMTVNFTANGENYRFVTRATVPRVGASCVQIHGLVMIQVFAEMPTQIMDRSERRRKAPLALEAARPDTRHDVLFGILATLAVLALIRIALLIFLPLVGIRIL